ncbi:MAG TPA: PLP-dependent aminotransferase family protein [Steroidobacteraceae bacterium]|nr:PLP-dependent aminotransferase family protein [Steroidobacteraceae bacterium]
MDYQFLLKFSPEEPATSNQRLLYVNLREAIAAARLPAGHRLPGSRALAEQLNVARNTIVHAYEQLCSEGYLLSDRQGTVVASLPAPPRRRPGEPRRAARLSSRARQLPVAPERSEELWPFTSGVPALDVFPLAEWQSAVRRTFQGIQARDLGYAESQGSAALRAAISDRLRVARGLKCSSEQVLITDGTLSALDICSRLLAEQGDVVWMENPGYAGGRSVFAAAGLRVHAISADAGGMVTADLATHPAPRFIYLTPSHQWPLGGVLPMRRRLELLAVAHTRGAWILEDDYDSDFRYGGEPLVALQGLTEEAPVIYLGTFSKTLFPGLRLGYLVAPLELIEPLRASVATLRRHGRQIEEATVARFMLEGRYTRHLSRMRKLYKERRQALQAALGRHLPAHEVLGADAGLHLVVVLPPGVDDRRVCELAGRRGLNPQPLSHCYQAGTDTRPGLVLGYGNTPVGVMDRCVRTLARCIEGSRA